jgi:hypothetical protein
MFHSSRMPDSPSTPRILRACNSAPTGLARAKLKGRRFSGGSVSGKKKKPKVKLSAEQIAAA